jgi:hypothetical protein
MTDESESSEAEEPVPLHVQAGGFAVHYDYRNIA